MTSSLSRRSAVSILAATAAAAGAHDAPAQNQKPPIEAITPPWEKFETGSGRLFTVPNVDNAPDLFGDVVAPDLVAFYGGNQFMAVPDLVRAFRAAHPQHARIFIETLPPGILADQIEQGALVIGNLRIDHKPDAFIAGKDRIERMQREKGLFAETRPINRNRLALMVRAGNPKGVRRIEDLGRDELRVAMPNPKWEGIGRQVETLYRQVGGEALARKVMDEKVKRGTTVLTDIHHRQTPMRLMADQSDVGPVWATEALYQRRLGHPIELVSLPEDQAKSGATVAAVLNNAPLSQAGHDFVAFLTSPAAQAIYADHGFMTPE